MLSLVVGYFSTNFILLMLVIGSILIFKRDSELGHDNTRFLFYVIILTVALSIVEYIEVQIGAKTVATEDLIMARKIFSWIGYALRPIAIMFFIRIISHWQKKTLVGLYALGIVNALIYATTFVPKERIQALAFTYDVENSFIRGPLGFSVHITTAIYIIIAAVVVMRSIKDRPKSEVSAILFCGIAGVFASTVETLGSSITGQFVNPTLITAGLVYYIFLHTQTTRTRSHEKDVLLRDQRTAMMVSEIEPRFIYDVLDHVKDTTLENPERTDRTIKSLVGYLDYNKENMDFTHPIPFEDELERTKHYIGIEQARHPGLTARLQIEDRDFKIPALTIQHFVDRAINYGLANEENGIITIKSFGSATGHTIIIQDNGKGFDQQKEKEKTRQGSHFGSKNVEDRLTRMVGGHISIVTKPDGGGTTVMVSIPRQDAPTKPTKSQDKVAFKTVDGVTINPNMPLPKKE